MEITSSSSESELQPELDEARVVHGRVHLAEARSAYVVDRHAELRMIEEVEEFRAEGDSHVLPRQSELLDHREVCVYKVGAIDGKPRSISEMADGMSKACGVDVLQFRPMIRNVFVAARSLIRTVPIVAVAAVVEEDPRSVGAVNQRKCKAGGDFFNHSQLPAAQQRVGYAVPVVAPLLAFAKGQVIDHAGNEIVVRVDL